MQMHWAMGILYKIGSHKTNRTRMARVLRLTLNRTVLLYFVEKRELKRNS
jgi:hypothetical protein